jgi:molybdopterin-guanine dinucleotide biosynthesis protein A
MSLPLLSPGGLSLPVAVSIEVCILAGGLSSRMGRNKAGLRLGRRTLLGHIRVNAAELALPLRVLRQDLVARCGPLGGIHSALKTTRQAAVLFLACDMPFVSSAILRSLLKKFDGKRPLSAVANKSPGFPLILPRTLLPTVEQLIVQRQFSLHNLTVVTRARLVSLPSDVLFNINTPADLAFAKKRLISAQEQLVKRR